MSDLRELLTNYFPNFENIYEQPIVNQQNQTVGWHSSVILKNDVVISSGCSSDNNIARRIAIAEALERAGFWQLEKDSESVKSFYLNVIPSTCGFAAGFENDKAHFRSICEAVERWAWSKWIDSHYLLREIPKPALNLLAIELLSDFQEIRFFQQKLLVQNGDHYFPLVFSVVLAFTEKGVFPGSRVSSSIDDPWEHSAIEAYRNYRISLTLNKKKRQNLTWLQKRVLYFGDNRSIAEIAIPTEQNGLDKWPVAQVSFQKQAHILPGVNLWRSLCSNFIPWHLGADNRFVY